MESTENNNKENYFTGLTPQVHLLSWISFVADIASEMLYPIIPIFLNQTLGASMTYIGFIEGVAELISHFLKTITGRYSDLIKKRKAFIVLGYTISALSRPIIGLAYAWPTVLFARAADRFGKGIRTSPRDALLAESVEKRFLGKAFGFHRGLDTLGAVIGPLICLYLINALQMDLRSIFIWALIPGLAAAVLSLLISEKQVNLHKPSRKIKEDLLESFNSLKKLKLPLEFVLFLLAWMIFSISNSSDLFLILKLKNDGFDLTQIILIYCLFNFVYASAAPYLGSLSDKIGRHKVLIFGLFIFSLCYFGFAFSTNKESLVLFYALYGLFNAATEGISKALAVEFLGEELKATGVGILGTTQGVCNFIACAVGGLMWDKLGSSAPFIYGATGALISCAGIILILKLKK